MFITPLRINPIRRGCLRLPGRRHYHGSNNDRQYTNPGAQQYAPTGGYRQLRSARGVTLVELIISMLIISIALVGVLSVMNFTTGRSADPMIQHQAIAIAEAYMEEILLQGYENPDGGYEGPDRSRFDDVEDYDAIDNEEPTDQIGGEAFYSLNRYEVGVVVETPEDDGISLNGIDAKKITVTVEHPSMGSIDLVGYRTDY
jgi:MSHA pilin protein MshD